MVENTVSRSLSSAGAANAKSRLYKANYDTADPMNTFPEAVLSGDRSRRAMWGAEVLDQSLTRNFSRCAATTGNV